LVGDCALSAENAATFERILLFLESDCEYEWPPRPGTPGSFLTLREYVLWTAANIITLGACYRRAMREYSNLGDRESWPFFRKEDYERELATVE
jgi:hypothetical protein